MKGMANRQKKIVMPKRVPPAATPRKPIVKSKARKAKRKHW
jgi:hypothetical protein